MTTTPERVKKMMSGLGLDQKSFGVMCGASKSVVNQWLAGLIKKIGPKYAYAIQDKAGYRAEWVMFGELPEKLTSPESLDQPFAKVEIDLPKQATPAEHLENVLQTVETQLELLHGSFATDHAEAIADMSKVGVIDVYELICEINDLLRPTLSGGSIARLPTSLSKRDRLVSELTSLAEMISEAGLERLIGMASAVAQTHPAEAKQTLESSG